MKQIQELEEAYCKAANALSRYGREHGFEPGARVIARFQQEPEKKGIIPPYGDAWSGRDHMSVPVWLDSGVLQPWQMSQLTLEVPMTYEKRPLEMGMERRRS